MKGGTLQKLRRQQGLTQPELAARIGVSTSTVSDLETGRVPLRLARALNIADVLGVQSDLITDAARLEGHLERVQPVTHLICTELADGWHGYWRDYHVGPCADYAATVQALQAAIDARLMPREAT